MAYSSVGRPRFYVSILQWLKSLGKLNGAESSPRLKGKSVLDLASINPTSQATFDGGGGDYTINFQSTVGNYKTLMPNDKNFFMVLGHEFGGNAIQFVTRTGASAHNWVANSGLVNYSNTVGYTADYHGFSISTGNDAHDDTFDTLQLLFTTYPADVVFKFGSVLYGTYWEPSHSPDLNLTMTREYGGIKTIETKGGSSLSNSFYRGSPSWGDLGAWELSDTILTPFAKSGRRVWDLSFSYLQQSDIFPEHSNLSDYGTDGMEHPFTDGTILQSDDFYSQVIHKTQGLPFVFQPDGNNNDPDNFAIAKFDMNSFSFQQTAPSLYSCKMKIREVW